MLGFLAAGRTLTFRNPFVRRNKNLGGPHAASRVPYLCDIIASSRFWLCVPVHAGGTGGSNGSGNGGNSSGNGGSSSGNGGSNPERRQQQPPAPAAATTRRGRLAHGRHQRRQHRRRPGGAGGPACTPSDAELVNANAYFCTSSGARAEGLDLPVRRRHVVPVLADHAAGDQLLRGRQVLPHGERPSSTRRSPPGAAASASSWMTTARPSTPYTGSANCYKITLTGSSGGNVVRIAFTQSATPAYRRRLAVHGDPGLHQRLERHGLLQRRDLPGLGDGRAVREDGHERHARRHADPGLGRQHGRDRRHVQRLPHQHRPDGRWRRRHRRLGRRRHATAARSPAARAASATSSGRRTSCARRTTWCRTTTGA